jgi:hypothetical protein
MASSALCILSILVMLVFRRRPGTLLLTSGGLIVASPLSIFIPLMLFARQESKLAGAIVVMMLVPAATVLLAMGVIGFLTWCVQSIYRAVRRS